MTTMISELEISRAKSIMNCMTHLPRMGCITLGIVENILLPMPAAMTMVLKPPAEGILVCGLTTKYNYILDLVKEILQKNRVSPVFLVCLVFLV
jgi:hypothetical protein